MKTIAPHFLPLLLPFLLSLVIASPPGKNAILLSNVQTLTLHGDRMTSHRRVSPIPQLKCTGPSKICKLYSIDTMRCTNQGHDYDEEDIQWTCTASLPSEFKLGSTDVICEGYRNAADKWILKGSCGVEYRLLLTEDGERRYGYQNPKYDTSKTQKTSSDVSSALAVIVFVGISVIILLALCRDSSGNDSNRQGDNRRRRPRGSNGGWGGGGGGGGGDDDDPPPPYDYNPGTYSKPSGRQSSFEPGFWTGAAAGAAGGSAAGYMMGRRSGQGTRSRPSNAFYDNAGEGSSRPSSSFSPSGPSTGFGSTRRR
ncbi:hypothetical protein BGW36DRAFT_433643 [Talaromyces proteolyticus]|uniref:Store-operated calcium entry-associated regulatory factor n=1 Tax=Talaromyces proteolyticus TaxID=1131652 RepID=A0AAD4PUQ8_9EURO|nr:uncharacterized protein BGW36DRAFT_433643 [Talaromyces proteolyticus]KAH8689640.1 hypothetical protein BGW36DRAFT_433643 [Talaromyces proteolyticus]